MKQDLRAGPATGEVCPTLADDLLRGADAIAIFVFGDPSLEVWRVKFTCSRLVLEVLYGPYKLPDSFNKISITKASNGDTATNATLWCRNLHKLRLGPD